MAEHSWTFAPGWPGIPARWTSSAKSGLGTSISRDSRVWFTLSHGILNEVYYPRVDIACTRDLGFIVTDGQTYFSEEKRDARSQTSQVVPGIPAYEIRNTAVDGRYRIEKEVLTDPWRDVVLQRVRFVPLQGTLADYRLYVLLAPHLANRGSGNTAWAGEYKGKANVFDMFARQQQAMGTQPEVDIHDIVGNDDHVVALGTAKATGPDGSIVEWRYTQIFHVKDGKTTEVWGMAENDAAVDPFLDKLPD